MTDPRGAARVARTWLFVPGDRPDRVEKACGSGASEVIIDLEDAVASENKASARTAVCGWLESGGSAWIRINSAATEWHTEDIEALARIESLRGIMVPKAEEPALLSEVRSVLGSRPGLVALIESAVGIRAAFDIAAVPGVDRLAFGSVDFALDVDAPRTTPHGPTGSTT